MLVICEFMHCFMLFFQCNHKRYGNLRLLLPLTSGH